MSGLLVKLNNRMRDTVGAAIALVALSMVALLAGVALAVDVGMMVTARTEAATLADAAAMAGAGVLVLTDSATAHDAAVAFGSSNNTVRGQNVTIRNEDVEVIPDEWTVKVTVHRTRARDSAVPTFFARIFGVNEVDIRAHAAAWSVRSSTIGDETEATCPALPLALLDKYTESNDEPGWQAPEEVVGWGEEDHGTLVRLKGKPNAGEEPLPVTNEIDYCNETASSSAWRCWWRNEEESSDTEYVEDKILGENCTDPVSDGDIVYNAAGNMQSQVHDPFRSLIDLDPDLEWCEDCGGQNDVGCVVEAPSNECFQGVSVRLRTVPVVDPSTINGTGDGVNAEVIGFVGVFVERVAETYAGNEQVNGKMNVYLRIVTLGGTGTGAEEGENDPEAFVRTVQLIE
ncbi:MAG TPA: pilus assembly protein TadG-related protein [Gemmatimonadota bacterium]|nr:pilus assembly protein TadG-related protein [Gemmatimonadota bacterium]